MSTILEAAAITPVSSMSTEQLVGQIAVTVLHIHEIKSQFPRPNRRRVKLFNDCIEVRVREQRKIVGDSKSMVQNRMVECDEWSRTTFLRWVTITAGMCELQSNQQ